MNKSSVAVRAFLDIGIDPQGWDLSKQFTDSLKPHMASIPSSLFLPWPTELPMREGQAISLDGIPTSICDLVVEEISHHYSLKMGVTTYVKTSVFESENIDLYALYYLAEEGFLLESMSSLKDVLETAGLSLSLERECK